MIERGEYWTLDNGQKYLVVSIIPIEEKEYVYLLNKDDQTDYIIAEYQDDNIEEVDDPDLLEQLIVMFNDDLRENLADIIAEYL